MGFYVLLINSRKPVQDKYHNDKTGQKSMYRARQGTQTMMGTIRTQEDAVIPGVTGSSCR